MMEELTNLGYIFACPKRDKLGRRVIITRPGVFDLDKFTNGDMCRIHGIAYETLMEDEENQIRGFVHFADGQGVGFAYLTLFTIKEAVRIVKNGEVRKSKIFIICTLFEGISSRKNIVTSKCLYPEGRISRTWIGMQETLSTCDLKKLITIML
nr:unnamed protein product [Callosobruchus chinensis]